MTFREFFEEKHGKMDHCWGNNGETMEVVQLRFMDTMAEYIDLK